MAQYSFFWIIHFFIVIFMFLLIQLIQNYNLTMSSDPWCVIYLFSHDRHLISIFQYLPVSSVAMAVTFQWRLPILGLLQIACQYQALPDLPWDSADFQVFGLNYCSFCYDADFLHYSLLLPGDIYMLLILYPSFENIAVRNSFNFFQLSFSFCQ